MFSNLVMHPTQSLELPEGTGIALEHPVSSLIMSQRSQAGFKIRCRNSGHSAAHWGEWKLTPEFAGPTPESQPQDTPGFLSSLEELPGSRSHLPYTPVRTAGKGRKDLSLAQKNLLRFYPGALPVPP